MIFCFLFLYIFIISSQVRAQTYSVLQFGAVGDGKTNDTKAIRDTLAAAANSNGGRVIFDAGYTFLTGGFNVTSNVILDVRGTILGSRDYRNYVLVQPLPWYGGGPDAEESGQMEWGALVRSYNAENITITGGGVINGDGFPWWLCARRNLSEDPCHGFSRPPLVRLHNTVDIKIYNINLTQSACWTLWLANTTNVHVHDAFITSAHNGHNTDGIDIDCSVNVLVENVYYDGNDDAIAVKSGRNYLGRTFGRTSENITIRNMTVGNSQGLSVGSEVSGGARNVTFENIFMNGTVYGPHVKSLRGRGGVVEDIIFTNITLYNTMYPIYLTMFYTDSHANGSTTPPTNETATPKFRNININNLSSYNATYGWYIDGLPESAINNTIFYNINMASFQQLVHHCSNIIGSCDNSTVLPYCPTCIVEECFDASSDCSQYIGLCSNPTYKTLLCSQCRKSCNLCSSC